MLKNHIGCHSQCPSCKENFDIINLGTHYETCIREKMKLIRGGRPRNGIYSAWNISILMLHLKKLTVVDRCSDYQIL